MKIQILMSTFNGQKYLRTQLDSIVEQDIIDKYLLIRDDGSTDGTLDIIEEYKNKYSWISYYKGDNIGVQRSFLDLISKADPSVDYIALADQDDQWLSGKLPRAVNVLEAFKQPEAYRNNIEASSCFCVSENYQPNHFSMKMPLLYCSDKKIVGSSLEDISVTVSRPVRKISFGNALVQNICTGCTAVFNQALAELLRDHVPKCSEAIIMHDWWLYLTASCFGTVVYDLNAYIKYRQHGNNTSGAMLNHRALLIYRLQQLSRPRGEIYLQALLFYHCYKDSLALPIFSSNKMQLQKLISAEKSFKGRLALTYDRHIYRQKYSDDLIYRGIILIGKL